MSENLHYYLQSMGLDVYLLRERNFLEVEKAQNSCAIQLSQLAKEVAACRRCALHKTRSQTVFARGNAEAKLMIIGEAPGFYEDKQGLPFVGKAGLLLNAMLKSISLTENEVYIANLIKCRPPENRDPTSDEIVNCSGYLQQQIQFVKPKFLLALGRFASQFLTNKSTPLNQLRQQIHYYEKLPCVVSYHPAYLLRNPSDKKKSYADLLLLRQLLKA